MISENIKKYRKANGMSQDELAQKLNVSRQSISQWENGLAQPTVDNLIALARIFNISSDELLDISTAAKAGKAAAEKAAEPAESERKHSGKGIAVAAVIIALTAVLGILIWKLLSAIPEISNTEKYTASEEFSEAALDAEAVALAADSAEAVEPEAAEETAEPEADLTAAVPADVPAEEDNRPEESAAVSGTEADAPAEESTAVSGADADASVEEVDLFALCKSFAIQKGTVNGDYSMYQQPSTLYGGYENEYFSISYWGDSDMVEFCLHCPLSDTLSINFYLRMRGGYDGTYEYASSKYYRSDGTSLRLATGYINPADFSDNYPLNCKEYIGSTDGQTEFMEESRVGICDLIKCLKNFVSVENIDCSWDNFGFINF